MGTVATPGYENWLVSDLPLSDVVRSTDRQNPCLIPGDRRTMAAQMVLNFERKTLRAIQRTRAEIAEVTLGVVVIDMAPSVADDVTVSLLQSLAVSGALALAVTVCWLVLKQRLLALWAKASTVEKENESSGNDKL